MKTPALRYRNLYKQINKFRPKSIMEIGVWLGNTAIKMITEAQKYHLRNRITYLGYDLFEHITDDEIELEHSKSTKAVYEEVRAKLLKTGANILLFPGYTKDTIPRTIYREIDFIFVDGGHSIETILTDWNSIQKFIGPHTIIIFDDYFYDRTDLGCRNLIDSLDRKKWNVTKLEPIDHFQKDGWVQHTQMVKVTKI